MKIKLYREFNYLLKILSKIKGNHLTSAEGYMIGDIKNTFCRETPFSLGLVICVLVATTPSFAMVEDDDTIHQFVSYIKSNPDLNDWNIDKNNAATCVFPVPLTDPTYDPHPVPNFNFLPPLKIEYDGKDLIFNKRAESTLYEGEINGENISLEASDGREGLSYIGDTPETKAIVFGPQSFSLQGKNAIFHPHRSVKSFINFSPPNNQNNSNLGNCLDAIRTSWKGKPTLTYEGSLEEGTRLKMTFQGNAFLPLSPTAILYALDTIQKKIGVFVKIELPHFRFQFEYLGKGDLRPNNVVRSFPGQFYYSDNKNKIYEEAKEQTTTWQNPSEEWLKDWGPKLITPDAPDLWEEQLGEFNRQRQPLPDPSHHLEKVLFIDPEDQHPAVGKKRKIPSARYEEARGPVRKKAKTIYSDGIGNLSIAGMVEEKWLPADNTGSAEESYMVHTYCDTRIRWKLSDDVFLHPKGIWPSGFYRGREDIQNSQIIWEKIDSTESGLYQMDLEKIGEMGVPIQTSGMTLESFVENLSYYPIKSLNLLQENKLNSHFLNEILFRMEELNEFSLKFNFENNLYNSIYNTLSRKNKFFDNFITILYNNTIKRNLKTLKLRFNKHPAFSKEMSTRLGAALANFENLQELRMEIPYVRSYTTISSWSLLSPLILVGASCDAIRLVRNISYEEHLILARKIAESQSLQRIKFYGVRREHDQDNIRTEIHKVRSDITVNFGKKEKPITLHNRS